MASENVKKAILKKKIGDIVYDLLVKTSADLVEVADSQTLTEKLAELNTAIQGKATSSDITTAIDNLINSAPGTYDTLGEIATWIQSHETEFQGLQAIAGKKMKGATAEEKGEAGTVPAPEITDKDKFLKGDGTWGTPTDTKYSKASADQDGLMSKEDFTKLQGLKNFDISSVTTDNVKEGTTNKYITAAEKEKLGKVGRILIQKDEPEDLDEADLFLQDLTEE